MGSLNKDPIPTVSQEQSVADRLNPVPIVQEKAAIIQKELSPDSHELAQRSPTFSGAVQKHFDGENPDIVRDIGWHKPIVEIPDPLIGGLSNGKLFALIRRFNKVRISLAKLHSEICAMLNTSL